MSDVTQLLPLVYEELRQLAVVRMANEKPGHTLQATALVHEAWLKIAGDGKAQFAHRRHFFKAAATAMQQILIDAARRLRLGANCSQAAVGWGLTDSGGKNRIPW